MNDLSELHYTKLHRLVEQFKLCGIRHTVAMLPRGAQAVQLTHCPFERNVDELTHVQCKPSIFISANGVESFHCNHPGCKNRTVASAMEAMGLTWWRERSQCEPLDNFLAFRDLYRGVNRKAIIQNLLYERDTINLIGSSKAKKSLLASELVLQVCAERPFLDLFPTRYPGKVLVLDYELHADTILDRITRQAEQLGLSDEVLTRFTVHRMRGDNYMRVDELSQWLQELPYGTFALVVIDALYRAFPKGFNENDNAGMTEVYNLLDVAADKQGCAFINVHHASKGNQADKKTSDIGSGAGAQSRAVDAHIALVEHSLPNHISMRAIVRACPEVEPIALRCDWPLWTHAPDVDPDDTAQGPSISPDELAAAVPLTPIKRKDFLAKKHAGCTKKDAGRLLSEAVEMGLVIEFREGSGANKPVLIRRAA